MKESVGEANLTVITIILIGTVLPVFYFIIPQILSDIKVKACCISNNGVVQKTIGGNKCVIANGVTNGGVSNVTETKAYYNWSHIKSLCDKGY